MLDESVNFKRSRSVPVLGGQGICIHWLHREFRTPTLDLSHLNRPCTGWGGGTRLRLRSEPRHPLRTVTNTHTHTLAVPHAPTTLRLTRLFQRDRASPWPRLQRLSLVYSGSTRKSFPLHCGSEPPRNTHTHSGSPGRRKHSGGNFLYLWRVFQLVPHMESFILHHWANNAPSQPGWEKPEPSLLHFPLRFICVCSDNFHKLS